MRRPSPRHRGYVLTSVLVVLLSVLVVCLIVVAALARNALVRRATDNLLLDSSTPLQVLGRPHDYGICEEPQVLLRDPDNGLLVLVGLRPERFTSRNQVFYDGPDCTGTPYLAPPAVPPPAGVLPPEELVGYLNGGLDLDAGGARVVYGVGAPAAWPGCTLGVDCDAGLLYRSTGAPPAVPAPPVISVWTSLAPDCAFGPGVAASAAALAGPPPDSEVANVDNSPSQNVPGWTSSAGSGQAGVFLPDLAAFDSLSGASLVAGVCEPVAASPTLVAAAEVLTDPGDPATNLLAFFTPPFGIQELTYTAIPATSEAVAAPGAPRRVTFTGPVAEGSP